MFRQYQFRRFDFLLVLLVLGLSIFGIVIISSAASDPTLYKKQIFGLVASFIIMIIVSLIDYHTLGKFYWLMYIFNILFLALVIFIGSKGGAGSGAQRWIPLGSFKIQPSEYSKILMSIFIAKFISNNKEKINNLFFLVQLFTTVAIPIYLIKKQPDLSTSLVLLFIMCILIFVGGLKYKYVIIILSIIIPLSFFMFWYILQPNQVLLKDYQVKRIQALQEPQEYKDLMLQQINALQAIGSGQLHGKGLYNGSAKKANFIIEPQTDFIFSVIGEELGFIGTSSVLLMIFLIIIKLLLIAKDAKDIYGMLLISGIISIIIFQTFVNIGVNTVILPNTGIPLPFVSYGLSSLSSLYIGIGIALNISMQRKGITRRG